MSSHKSQKKTVSPLEVGTAIHQALASGQIDTSLCKELRDVQRKFLKSISSHGNIR